MAKIDLKFLDFIDSEEFIKVKADKKNKLIRISSESQGERTCIVLDKSTAIKLCETLLTKINEITESDVQNG